MSWQPLFSEGSAEKYLNFQGDPIMKTVFIVFFQGDQLKTRVKKICEGFVRCFLIVLLNATLR